MRKTIIAALVCVLFIGGCFSIGRFLAPIKTEELASAAQAQIAQLKADGEAAVAAIHQTDAEIIESLKAQVSKLKTASPYKLVFVIGVALGIVGFTVSVFFLVAGWIPRRAAIAGAVASVALVVICGAFDRYGGPIFLGFAILLGLSVLGALGYGIWSLKKSETGKAAFVAAVVPALEDAEPKKEGDKPSGPIKAAIAEAAKQAGTSDLVSAEVEKVKASM
jgi:hypothetical protein